MRKIEAAMMKAITNRKNFKQGNTKVEQSGPVAKVFLHGNFLGSWRYASGDFCPQWETVRNYPTNTTLSRMRALGVDTHRKGGHVYINHIPV